MMYLPDYFMGNSSQSFRKEDLEILYWHFGNEVNDTVKLQIERLLKYAVKIIKNKEERRKRYLLPLKYLFCYAENSGLQDILKMEAAQEAEVALLLRKQMGESNVKISEENKSGVQKP